MIIELGRLRTVRLFWRDSLECVVAQSRIISLITEYRTLAWVIVNGFTDSDRVLVELVNPIAASLPVWPSYTDLFDTEVQAKHSVLTLAHSRLRTDVAYMQWASTSSGWSPRLSQLPAERVTVTEIP